MQISSTPLKWTIPFATNDSAKVEIPATTSDPTRFSLSLGSPPLTGQPPETGGVPPQLEDFNGAMNQISRITWWSIGGGPLPFDAVWSADPNVNGYANGAQIPTADGQGRWISVVDNNTINPDTVGTNWVPGFAYGLFALTGQTGGTTTLTPAQAIKRVMTVAGTLTSNLTIVMPTWLQEWTVTNNTTGAFTVTVKTAAGSGVIIPQDSSPTRVRGDGTNITQLAENIAVASQPTHPLQSQQKGVARFTANGNWTAPPGVTQAWVSGVAGGGGGGASALAGSPLGTAGGGGGGGAGQSAVRVPITVVPGTVYPVVIGAAGTGGTTTAGSGNPGGNGTATQLGTAGALLNLTGGTGGGGGATSSSSPAGGSGGVGFPQGSYGNDGTPSVVSGGGGGGGGGSSPYGGGGGSVRGAQSSAIIGTPASGFGGGGGGGGAAYNATSTGGAAGGAGAPGLLIVEW